VPEPLRHNTLRHTKQDDANTANYTYTFYLIERFHNYKL